MRQEPDDGDGAREYHEGAEAIVFHYHAPYEQGKNMVFALMV